MSQQTIGFALGGGLDLITPAVSKKPGYCIAALNYEPTAGGYRRLRGFERYDGQPAPSEAVAYQVTYDDGGLGGNVEQVIAGTRMSGDQLGYAAEDATLVSGAWGTPTAVGRAPVLHLGGQPRKLDRQRSHQHGQPWLHRLSAGRRCPHGG
jgi:hypothetical protein